MRRMLLYVVALILLSSLFQSFAIAQMTPAAGIKKLGWHWKKGNQQGIEWIHYFEATLTFDGTPAENMDDYDYHWERRYSLNEAWGDLTSDGAPYWSETVDHNVDVLTYVRVTVSGDDPYDDPFSVTSVTVTLVNEENPVTITWDFKNHNNQHQSTVVSEWYGSLTNPYPDVWNNHATTTGVLRIGPNILRVQRLIVSPNQKFNYWNTDQSWVKNHDTHTLYEENDVVGGRYNLTYDNTTVNGVGIDDASLTVVPSVQDPWLIDTNDPAFSDGLKGYRSLGMSAPFKTVQSGSNNLGWNGLHKGVFLDQTAEPGQPYYSVRAPQTQTVGSIDWIFQNWDTSGVSMTLPGTLSGGYYEAPVVFRNWGSRTVTANYKAHLASNNSDVLSHNGQRRLAKQESGNDQTILVYPSAGEIWASVKSGSSESPFATIKKSHLFWEPFGTKEEARRRIEEYLEVFYNRIRRHSSLGYKSPVTFELQQLTLA